VALLARDHRGLARQERELLGVGVVVEADHHPADVEASELAEDRPGEVLALEAEQEQLRHLALEREPPGQLLHAARDALAAGLAAGLGRRWDHTREK
jgi:hypothetical protein